MGISAVIIAIFLAIAFSPTLRHPVDAAKKIRERYEPAAWGPHTGTRGLELIAAGAIGAMVSELPSKTHNGEQPPSSPGNGSFRRIQQEQETLMRRRETLRELSSLTPVTSRRAAQQRRRTVSKDMV